jgi:hypothetical protein
MAFEYHMVEFLWKSFHKFIRRRAFLARLIKSTFRRILRLRLVFASRHLLKNFIFIANIQKGCKLIAIVVLFFNFVLERSSQWSCLTLVWEALQNSLPVFLYRTVNAQLLLYAAETGTLQLTL